MVGGGVPPRHPPTTARRPEVPDLLRPASRSRSRAPLRAPANIRPTSRCPLPLHAAPTPPRYGRGSRGRAPAEPAEPSPRGAQRRALLRAGRAARALPQSVGHAPRAAAGEAVVRFSGGAARTRRATPSPALCRICFSGRSFRRRWCVTPRAGCAPSLGRGGRPHGPPPTSPAYSRVTWAGRAGPGPPAALPTEYVRHHGSEYRPWLLRRRSGAPYGRAA